MQRPVEIERPKFGRLPPTQWEDITFSTVEAAQAHIENLLAMSGSYPAWYRKLWTIMPYPDKGEENT